MHNWTNVDDPHSLSSRFRSRRFELFERLAAELPRPLTVLDIGGTVAFWERCGWAARQDVHITVANITLQHSAHDNITTCIANAADLSRFPDHSFDIAFSNSVIEHLFTLESQQRMAEAMKRVAGALWLQTPNFWFPMEPHFHIPGWQWLPTWLRIAMIRRIRCGNRGPCADKAEAAALVREVRLLSAHTLRELFPHGTLISEGFAGLTKSWIVAQGFPDLHVRQQQAASLANMFKQQTSSQPTVQQA